jgi:8-oxo-(d)GTP phosphatase
MPLLLIRHAWAGSRQEWPGDDSERPLDERGERQARELVALLADLPVSRLLTSPYLRCVQTVEPLAKARGLQLELRDELGEELQLSAGITLVQSLVGTDLGVCGHGGLESALRDPPPWKKGAVFVVDDALRVSEVRRASGNSGRD